MKCPYCNAEISDDSLFCGSCGKKLPQIKDCVKCGKSIETNSDFCPYCGAKQNLSVSTSKESEKPLTSPSSVQQSKKSSKVVSFIASCILALAVLGGAAYYWFEIREDYSLEGLAQVSKGEYELFHFEKGFAAVKVGNNMGVINKQGEMIAPVKYISTRINLVILIKQEKRLYLSNMMMQITSVKDLQKLRRMGNMVLLIRTVKKLFLLFMIMQQVSLMDWHQLL